MKSSTYDRKTVDGMILKMLWEKVLFGLEPAQKEVAIKKLRSNGDYDKLIQKLIKLRKEKVERILNLLSEVITTYVS